MARILYAWELGGGSGHIGPFHGIANALVNAGHQLTLAVREPNRVVRMYDGIDVSILQAPVKPNVVRAPINNPVSYPQVLQNVGFGSLDSCEGIVRAWKSIIDLVEPDLIIADHAPGILLACSGEGRNSVIIGNGFMIPPPLCPMPQLVIANDANSGQSERDRCVNQEANLTNTINSVLTRMGLRSLNSVGDLFASQHSQFLITFRELDHYPDRKDTIFRGSLSYANPGSKPFTWPRGSGPRIYGYLKSSKGLGHLLDAIGNSGFPSIIVSDGISVEQLRRIAKPNMQFYDHPLPIEEIARQSDVAILNATHGVTCSMLLAGKPMLQLPHNLEQYLTARRTVQLGAAIQADKDDGLNVVAAFHQLCYDSKLKNGAQQFADRYHDYDPQQSAVSIADAFCQRADEASSSRL